MNKAYPEYKNGSGWFTPDYKSKLFPSFPENDCCDSLIIGCGYTGISIAKHLSEYCPNDDIIIIDADNIGKSSPGRNSGFAIETALTAADASSAGVLNMLYARSLKKLFEHAGWNEFLDRKAPVVMKGAATDRGRKELDKLAEFLKHSNQKYRWMDAKEVESIIGSDYYTSAIELFGTKLVNPYELVCDMVKELKNSIKIYENSPALEIKKNKGGWIVNTNKGSIQTRNLFLANNAFAKHLGFGKSNSVTIYTFAGMTEPLSITDQEKVMGSGQWGMLPSMRLGTTLRTTEDKRLLARSVFHYEHEGSDGVKEKIERILHARFPHLLSHLSLTSCWGGGFSMTYNEAPLWGELKPGLYASIGCNGVGIVKCWLLGEQLANLACRKPHANIHSLFGKPTWLPPEPFRKMGFLAVSTAEMTLTGKEM